MALISPAAPGTQRRSVGPNWTDAAERFQAHKINSGQVKPSNWQKNYAGRIKSVLKLLAGSNGPTTGKARLQKLATGEPGSRGRVVRVEYVAQFLRFAVAEVGVDERWAPPSSDALADIKGRAVPNQAPDLSKGQGQAVPINDAAFLELYDSIPDARWKLAVGLMGVFGLRPVELNYISTEGKALRCSFVKRTTRGQTKPRLIEALDPIERPGLGQQLLLELSSGLTGLPPLGSEDKAAASAVSTYLNRRRLKIDPSCKRMIRSMASLEYAPGKSVADAKSDHGHMTDALGYLCLGIAKGLLPYSIGASSFQIY